MTSFKRWFGAGAIVLVALALIACPSMLPTVANEIGDMEFGAGDIGKTKTVSSLGGYFNVRDDATYDASSSDDTVVTASVADTTLTVTAKGSGTANVTVTAKDRDGTVAQTFSVTVAAVVVPPSNGPPLSKTIPDASLQVGGTKMLTLSRYFTDPEGDSLTYSAVSDKPAIAAVTDPDADSMITITAVAAGTAMITVTANDSTNDAVPQTFYVDTTTSPANEPPMGTDIADVPLKVEGKKSLTLSMYFTDDEGDLLTYSAVSDKPAIATVTVPDADSMITITAVAVGQAKITVTASDGTNDPVSLMFDVMVSAAPAAPNMPPRMTMPLPDLKRLDDAGNVTIDLSEYFEDPEKGALLYSVEIKNTPADSTVIRNHPTLSVDGTKLNADTLVLEILAVGVAEVTVTVTDLVPQSVMDTFKVTVTAGRINTPPTMVTGEAQGR